MKNILITGGAGFIGSHFLPYFLQQHPDYTVVNLDKLTYAGSLANLTEVSTHPRHHFVQGDITDRALVDSLFQKFKLQGVIHFAAESHVDRSIQDASTFVTSNLEGTLILLDVARLHWLQAPDVPYPAYQESRFLQVSTDEVYGSLGSTGLFTETTCYAPNNPYSATKAGADFLVRSYHHTYGLQVITTHGSNTYGPRQYPEKLIPRIIEHALKQLPIPIHGQGMNIRDWLYVLDHCKGIDAAFHKGQPGEHYNLGGQHEETNLQIAKQICSELDRCAPLPKNKSYQSFLTFVVDRPGNDQRYALSIAKAMLHLGWKPLENFQTGLQKTVQWYLKKYPPTAY